MKPKVENLKFTCSICNKSIKNKDGYYMKYDRYKSIKVCKIHVADRLANKKEQEAYAEMREG